jgi:hypothetical protein
MGWRSQGGSFIIPCSFTSFKAAFAAFLADLQPTPLFLQAVAFPWHRRLPGIKVATSQQRNGGQERGFVTLVDYR